MKLGSRIPPFEKAETARYVVFKKGNVIYAKDGENGTIEFQSSDAVSVIQQALNSLTPGRTWKEKVLIKGMFTITDTIKIPSYAILEIQGELKLANGINKNMIENSDPTGGNAQIEVIGGGLHGNSPNQTAGHGIYFSRVLHP